MNALKRYLIAGIVALSPLLVTVMLIRWPIGFSSRISAMLPPTYLPEMLLGISFPGLDILLAILFIILISAITRGSRSLTLPDSCYVWCINYLSINEKTNKINGEC